MENFTAAQREAVMCNANEILVSAAAGSGKTAVLTQRIVRHISDGVPLDKLLIVTFTEAASAEMRERLEKKLTESDTLAHHAPLLSMADISTIHAFCRKLIKENFQQIEIDPAFKVGDDAELGLIKSQVMDELFEAEYSRENNADFLDLVDVYGGKTTDGRLDSLVRGIYDFMESDPFPAEAAKRYAAAFDEVENIEATPWAKIAVEELALGLADAIESLRQAIKICNSPGGPVKYAEKLLDELEMLEDLGERNFEKFPFPQTLTFTEMYAAFSKIEWGSLPRVTAKDEVDPALKERVQRIRNKAVKERMRKLSQGVFFAPPQKMISDLAALRPRVNALMRLAQRFSDEYAKEKRARNLMDFSDLEHFAIRILYPNGPLDMTPANIGYKYHEVLIDEYQDSNEIQELILSAVAERRFTVGDVKQSIYRFRRANPEMFLRKYESFRESKSKPNLRGQGGAPPCGGLGVEPPRSSLITLSDNFRSRPEVLNAVNFLFSQLMSRTLGDVEYDENAALYPGRKEYPALPHKPVMQMEILDQASGESDEDTEPLSNIIAETRVIAACINELLETRMVFDEKTQELRLCKPGDIAILSRSFSKAGEVVAELKNHGIDAVAEMREGFFERPEVQTALAFLRVTDNPRQDIELIAALTGPVYAITPDELAEIAQSEKSEHTSKTKNADDFFDRLSRSQNEKARRFLSDLANWREAAVFLPISRLIGYIYDSTGYPSHVANMPEAATCQANLRLLIERAIEFEETGFKGLFHFIRYIERLSAAGGIASAAEPAATDNTKVRLMTIHKSKGLEFPIVICAFLAKKFNTEDERRPVILHSTGVGPFYVDTKLRTRANTLARFALSRLTRRENLSEELRCLYVATTRAQELLILTGRVNNFAAAKEKWSDNLGASSYLDWIMPCLLQRREEAEKIFKIRTWGELPAPQKIPAKPGEKPKPVNADVTEVFLQKNILPSKLSISEIKRLYDITPDSSFREESPLPAFEPPSFIKAESGITPVRMGSALHTVTEHIDFERDTTPEAIKKLLNGLVGKNLLSKEEAAAIDQGKIERLVNSQIAKRLRNAAARNKLYRETPFVLALPASDLYPNATGNEKILVHGIIDCHFEEDGKLVLLDFKSDYIPHSTPLSEWAKTHSLQMQIYRQALEKSSQMQVSETLLYSFSRGKTESL